MFWSMHYFQNSTYLDSATLMNFSFSTKLNALLTQIGRYGIELGTLVGNFGDPSKLHFHNLIGSPSIRLQTLFVGETWYCMTSQPNESTKIKTNAYQCAVPKFQERPSNNLKPKFKNLESLRSTLEWRVTLVRPWTPSLNLPKYNCFVLSNFLTNTQNNHQYPHVYDQLQEIQVSPPQTHPLQSTMKDMLTSNDSYCPSHNYPLGIINLLAKA